MRHICVHYSIPHAVETMLGLQQCRCVQGVYNLTFNYPLVNSQSGNCFPDSDVCQVMRSAPSQIEQREALRVTRAIWSRGPKSLLDVGK